MTLLVSITKLPDSFVAFDPNKLSIGGTLKNANLTLVSGTATGDAFTDSYLGTARHRVYEVDVSGQISENESQTVLAHIGVVNAAGVPTTVPIDVRYGDKKFGVELDEAAQTLVVYYFDDHGTPSVYGSDSAIGAGPWSIYVQAINCETQLNPGVSPFLFAAQYAAGYLPWTVPAAGIGPLYLSDDPYISQPTDTPANQLFEGRLFGSTSFTLRRQLYFRQWGNGYTVSKSSATLNIVNHDGALDSVIVTDVRDQPVTLQALPAGAASLTEAWPFPPLSIDTVVVNDDQALSITLTDPLARTENILPVAQVNKVAADGTSNALFPFTFGVVDSVPLAPVNEAQLLYSLGDDPNVGVLSLRDMGFPSNQFATPPDWTVNDPNGSITLARGLVGVAAADMGPINAALAQNGGIATASSTMNANFAPGFANNGNRTGVTWGTSGGWNSATSGHFPEWWAVRFKGARRIDRVIVYSLQDNYAAPVEPGHATTGTLYVVSDFAVQTLGDDGVTWTTVATVAGNNLIKKSVDLLGLPPTNAIRILVTNAQGHTYARLVEVECWTNACGGYAQDVGKYGFSDAVRYLADRSNGDLPQPVDIDVVDGVMEYAGSIGFHSDQPTKIQDILQPICDTFHASLYYNNGGELNAFVLQDPENVDSSLDIGVIEAKDLRADLQIDWDYATNLSTRAYGQRNYVQVQTFATDASITASVKAQLSANYRVTKCYSGPLARMYSAARNAPPMPTLLNDPGDVQRFIDHLGNLYRVPRIFVRAKIYWMGGPLDYRRIDFGRTVTLKADRYRLGAGRRGLIVGIEIDPLNNTAMLMLWMRGSA